MKWLRSLFAFLNRSKITQYQNVHNLKQHIEIDIDQYAIVMMDEYELDKLKWCFREIEKIITRH